MELRDIDQLSMFAYCNTLKEAISAVNRNLLHNVDFRGNIKSFAEHLLFSRGEQTKLDISITFDPVNKVYVWSIQ